MGGDSINRFQYKIKEVVSMDVYDNDGNKPKRTEVQRYDWSQQEELYLKNLVRSMYNKGMNIAEIRNDFMIMLGIAIYELEIDIGME